LRAPARNRPLVPGRLTNHDKRPSFCHGSLHDPGLKGCLYIKAATLLLQHLASFSSPIRRHHRRCVLLLLLRRCHPPRPLPSVAPPCLLRPRILRRRRPPRICRPPTRPRPPPRSQSAAVGPRNAGDFLPNLPQPPGLLLPIILIRVVLPGLRGSATAARRVPCRPAGLCVVASARASTSSPRPAASAFSLIVVLPNAGRGAPSLPTAGVHRPCPAAPKF
jgi:hypothetical protein